MENNSSSVQEVGHLAAPWTNNTAPAVEGQEAHSGIAGASTGSKLEGQRQMTTAKATFNSQMSPVIPGLQMSPAILGLQRLTQVPTSFC